MHISIYLSIYLEGTASPCDVSSESINNTESLHTYAYTYTYTYTYTHTTWIGYSTIDEKSKSWERKDQSIDRIGCNAMQCDRERTHAIYTTLPTRSWFRACMYLSAAPTELSRFHTKQTKQNNASHITTTNILLISSSSQQPCCHVVLYYALPHHMCDWTEMRFIVSFLRPIVSLFTRLLSHQPRLLVISTIPYHNYTINITTPHPNRCLFFLHRNPPHGGPHLGR